MSKAEIGSSAMSTVVDAANARAIAILWRWPPENWWGNRSTASSGKPTFPSSSAAFRSATDFFIPPTSKPSMTCTPIFLRGFNDPYGSWKIICRFLKCFGRRPRVNFLTLSPSNVISPSAGFKIPTIAFPNVDFPQPDSPTSPRISPGLRPRSTPATARTFSPFRSYSMTTSFRLKISFIST